MDGVPDLRDRSLVFEILKVVPALISECTLQPVHADCIPAGCDLERNAFQSFEHIRHVHLLVGYAVKIRVTGSKVCKADIVDMMIANKAGEAGQVLSPIDVGVAEITPAVRRTTNGFVEV